LFSAIHVAYSTEVFPPRRFVGSRMSARVHRIG
jgi:hypothetical protein